MKRAKHLKRFPLLTMLALGIPLITHAESQNYIIDDLENSIINIVKEALHLDTHVKWDIPVTANDCGADLNQPGKVYALVEDLTCSSIDTGGEPQALLLSADNSKLLLNHHFIRFAYTTPGSNNPDLDGIVVTGNQNLVKGPGIVNLFRNNLVIRDSSHNIIEGLMIKSSDSDGVLLENASRSKVIKNKIKDSDDNGVELLHSSNNTIADNVLFNMDRDAISLTVNDENMTTSNNLITHNLIELVDNNGIGENYNGPGPSPGHVFNDNIISHNKIINVDEGIEVNSGDGQIIEYNEISGAQSEGIDVFNEDNDHIKYNTIIKANDHGIDIRDSNNNVVAYNDITLSQLSAIRLRGVDDGASVSSNEITHNHISESGQSGILLLASAFNDNITINNNIITDNYISDSNRQAISLLDENQAAGANEISGNIINNNEAKHNLNASPAYSECTLAGDVNTWGVNDANNIQITPPDPDCALT